MKRSVIDGDVFRRTMKMAEEDIDAARGSLKQRNWAWSMVQAYSSMLNVSRAILFKDGYVERSHYCVVEYLRYNYYDEYEDHIEKLDLMRKERHQILYNSRETVNEITARLRVRWAEGFLGEILNENKIKDDDQEDI
ncbi:MAG: HEPN domain-containing protein [Candidatus Thermoplasmatota archaeon]|nr:HEPN domain-containing protein [Candidatus Thermoplasmatota archaeon]